jgi:3-hydroxy-9,10-secoandrosta-1,3,5(10)-triene-9,17-dione monooxygenase reductase component
MELRTDKGMSKQALIGEEKNAVQVLNPRPGPARTTRRKRALQPSSVSVENHLAGYFASGVAIITTLDLGRPIGFTVNSLSTVSFMPPTISFCITDLEANWPLIESMDAFCVNLLAEGQKDICDVFARQGGTRFQTSEHQQTRSGLPLLNGILTWIECRTANIFRAGDHAIVLGQALDMATVGPGKPLVFYQGRLGTFKTT